MFFLPINMAWRNLIEVHPRNISTKLFENRLNALGEEDFESFHYGHIRQNSPALWRPCFSTNQHDLIVEQTWPIFNDWLIGWGLTPFLTISQLYHGGQFTYSSHTSTPHNNLPKQVAAFPHRLSPLAEDEWRMTFVNRRKESWPSRDSNSQPLDWQPVSLPTELPGLGDPYSN